MKALLDLRNNLKDRGTSGPKQHRSLSALSASQKNEASVRPPQKVLRAHTDYNSQSPHEISFHKGDFFHVLSDIEPSQNGWIEACNPVTNSRGFVSLSYFDVLSRTTPRSTIPLTAHSELNPGFRPSSQSSAGSQRSTFSSWDCTSNGTFATIKYDFKAELPHELSVKEGDGVFVVARSNEEWLVAKPLEYVGMPGLIPTNYITFCDMRTGKPLTHEDNISVLSGIPSVYEWGVQNNRAHQQTLSLSSAQDPLPQDSSSPYVENKVSSKQFPQTPQCSYNMDDYFSSLDSFSPNEQTLHSEATSTARPVLPLSVKLAFVSLDLLLADSYGQWVRLHVVYSVKCTPPVMSEYYERRELVLFRLYHDFAKLRQSLELDLTRSMPTLTQPVALPILPPIDHEGRALKAFAIALCALPNQVLQEASIQRFLEVRAADYCHVTVSHDGNTRDVSLKGSLSNNRSLGSQDSFEHHNSARSSTNTKYSASDSTSLSDFSHHRIKVVHRGERSKVIALRISSTVSYELLVQKVQDKFGSAIQSLEFAETPGQCRICDDEDLRAWLTASLCSGNKLMLYASV